MWHGRVVLPLHRCHRSQAPLQHCFGALRSDSSPSTTRFCIEQAPVCIPRAAMLPYGKSYCVQQRNTVRRTAHRNSGYENTTKRERRETTRRCCGAVQRPNTGAHPPKRTYIVFAARQPHPTLVAHTTMAIRARKASYKKTVGYMLCIANRFHHCFVFCLST